MIKKIRILIVSTDLWNDVSNGNNIQSNWFDEFDAEFANIYTVPGLPNNKICTRYFQVTDAMMAKSFLGKKAGRAFTWNQSEYDGSIESTIAVEQENIGFYKTLRMHTGELLRWVRDFLWEWGRYDKKALKQFIDDFNPDIVFCPHLFSMKSRRLERIIHSMTNAPMVCFNGDAEASLRAISYNPLFWYRRIRDHMLYPAFLKKFSYAFTFSPSWSKMQTEKYGVSSEPLYKCIDAINFEEKTVHSPIKMVYAGSLYCNRWKTLSVIGNAMKIINEGSKRIEMYVYSQSVLTEKQKDALSEDKYIHLMGCVNPNQLPQIYKDADIALHVESFDKKFMLETEHSFSTKLTDLMVSSCAILAICWDKNSGWNYVKENDAAICLSSYDEVLPKLIEIVERSSIIQEYAKKAYECGVKNHNREKIQKQIRDVFERVIADTKSKN